MESVTALKDSAKDLYDRHPKAVAGTVAASTAALAAAYAWRRAANYVPATGRFTPDTLPSDAYDGECVFGCFVCVQWALPQRPSCTPTHHPPTHSLSLMPAAV